MEVLSWDFKRLEAAAVALTSALKSAQTFFSNRGRCDGRRVFTRKLDSPATISCALSETHLGRHDSDGFLSSVCAGP